MIKRYRIVTYDGEGKPTPLKTLRKKVRRWKMFESAKGYAERKGLRLYNVQAVFLEETV